MKVVLSPHLDDAVFSVAEAIAADPRGVVVACPFAAIPTDPAGREKYQVLHREHAKACDLLGVERVDGPFLDDVYPDRPLYGLPEWLTQVTADATEVWVPFGIWHPDHQLVAMLAQSLALQVPVVRYEELPYRVHHPHLTVAVASGLYREGYRLRGGLRDRAAKLAAVRCYASQLQSDITDSLLVPERVWTRP